MHSDTIEYTVQDLFCGKWRDTLTIQQQKDLLLWMRDKRTRTSVSLFLSMSLLWLQPDSEENSPTEQQEMKARFILRLLEETSESNQCFASFEFEGRFVLLLKRLLPYDSSACFRLALGAVDFTRGERETETLSFLERNVSQYADRDTVFLICECLAQCSESRIPGKAFHTLVRNMPTDSVLEWIAEDAGRRAPIIAYHLPPPSVKKVCVPHITRRVLDAYGEQGDVDECFLEGAYNWRVRSGVTKELEDQYDKEAPILREYQKDTCGPIRKWADCERRYLKSGIDSSRELDERYRDAADRFSRFEDVPE